MVQYTHLKAFKILIWLYFCQGGAFFSLFIFVKPLFYKIPLKFQGWQNLLHNDKTAIQASSQPVCPFCPLTSLIRRGKCLVLGILHINHIQNTNLSCFPIQSLSSIEWLGQLVLQPLLKPLVSVFDSHHLDHAILSLHMLDIIIFFAYSQPRMFFKH